MLPGKTYKPEDFLHIIRKRIWVVLVPWALIASGTAGVVRLLPDQYRSQAQIQVVPPRVPGSIMPAANQSTVMDRLRATEAVILSRTRLERLIKEFNLYEEERKTKIMEDVVTLMRRDVKTLPTKGDIFQVSYTGRNPVTVMKVTDKLASYFIEESLRDGQRRAEGTSSFVEAEVEEKHRQLLEIEDKLAKYNIRHSGELPTQVGSNLQAVANIQTQISNLTQSMTNDMNRRRDVERQIADLETESGPTAVVSTVDPATMSGSAVQNLNFAKTQLDLVIAKGLKPTHMDYVKWERLVKQYQKEVDAQALRTPVSSTAGLPPAEQARQKKLVALREEVEMLKGQIKQKEAQEKQLRDRALQYQAKVDSAPIRTAELTELMREYDTVNGIYKSLLAKREAAAMSVNLERRQIGEQFTLVDAAQVPQKPVSPDRFTLNLLGLGAGLVVGIFLVALLEYRDSSFKTDNELAGLLSLPVLAVVPLMLSDAERRAQFRRRLFLNLSLGSVVAVCLAVLTYSFVNLR
jgi:polysaccharide chain length determinant protein (PEP-CTERM system associated)